MQSCRYYKGLGTSTSKEAKEYHFKKLCNFLKSPDENRWQEKLLEVVDKIERAGEMDIKKERCYLGELEPKTRQEAVGEVREAGQVQESVG